MNPLYNCSLVARLITVFCLINKFPLENEVHVDEFEIGTPQKGEQGRSKSENKIRVVIALEYRDGKSGRGYAKVIEDYSSKSLKNIFDAHISKDAKIITDGWSGYKPLMKKYPHFEQKLSNKGQNFKMLHIQIRNFKCKLFFYECRRKYNELQPYCTSLVLNC